VTLAPSAGQFRRRIVLKSGSLLRGIAYTTMKMIDNDNTQGIKGISFGPFRFTPSRRQLERNGVAIPLGGRALDILTVLLERHQQVVTKRELFARVWPNINVDESSLRVHIRTLRKALGDGESSDQYLTNVPGRGYCFVAPLCDEQPTVQPTPDPALWAHSAVLPRRIARVIGREADLEAITNQLLAQRFVSIVGSGGVGKTAVAAAVVRQLSPEFDGNVVFLDLGMINDPTLVVGALATAVGMAVVFGDPISALQRALKEKRALLLLDGCEHVAEVTATLCEAVFVQCPNVHILATSREPLRAASERVHRLGPLACPPDNPNLSATEILTFPAIQLFVERLGVGPASTPGDVDLSAIAIICRRLDGIALALELAAGGVESYGLKGITSLLGSLLALYLPGKRGAIPRQKTLHATLDWSYALLSKFEQAVLRQLSIFAGSFSLDDVAPIVARSDDTGTPELFEGVAELISKSWIIVEIHEHGIRYRLLDTTRTYLRQLLTEKDEVNAAAERHALHSANVLERISAIRPTRQQVGLDHDAYLANARDALNWCFSSHGHRELGVRLAAAAASFFLERSLLSECRNWMEKAIAILDQEKQSPYATELWTTLALSLMLTEGNGEATQNAFSRALEFAQTAGDLRAQLRLHSGLHLLFGGLGDFRKALVHAQSSHEAAETLADPTGISLATAMLGAAHHFAGDQATAQTHCEAVHGQSPAHRDPYLETYGWDRGLRASGALARVLWLRGYANRALATAKETIERGRRLDHPVPRCMSLMFSAWVFFWVGDLAGVEAIITELLEKSEKHSLMPYNAVGIGMSGRLLVGRGRVEDGICKLTECRDRLAASRHTTMALPFMTDLAESLSAVGAHVDATETIDGVIALDDGVGGSWYTPEMLRAKGVVVTGSGVSSDATRSVDFFLKAAELARRQSSPAWELRAVTDLVASSGGQDRRHMKRLKSVYDSFSEGHETPDMSSAERLLKRLF
jgi:predicted ATPase/DNA-binding winged helix-turn-helix (wHTH) protein